ncbi:MULTISPECIES: sodium:solute symporter family protein [unclassified Leeuwenhoekiella]|uniref:sodium:solute symporter family protein n=1 Tax=unclassified Leeuwenhoekiella TaxID=2615029 RepID=UPI000C3CE75D|nr:MULTISPECIES: sodium:solute symporter family protein [unclassified Leeuwenhoekiella]MAW94390.1 sodium:solute symporter [Leeuwenhoekiella sp.]MBA81067.1 sodium:solute symporter [Leeuwenhoekiella sp.]|tara:strand:- start:330 stop:2204 length:1875 start_codon:yes stop_codon:yes gene_type:complete
MELIDVIIIAVYLLLTIGIGIYVAKKASRGLDSYFLGGKSIKWYYLGLSNGSGMFDVSGTAWMVGILFLYGVKSFMFMWIWPIFNQVFVMMFLAVWIRRSNVMTGSEWILSRFGDDRAGRASHLIVAVFAVVASVGFIAYFFEGAGKFMTVILPWDASLVLGNFTLLNAEQVYALILILLTTIYTIKGGMFSVVSTEVLQFGIMVLAGILVAGYTFFTFSDTEIQTLIPAEWKNLAFGSELTGFWAGDYELFNNLIDTQGYKMFGAFIGMSLFKGFFASIAGPTPSYDMQRILSTRTAKDAAYMSGFTNLVLFIPRYLLIAAIVVLGLVYIAPELAKAGAVTGNDLEVILPQVINNHVPVGIKGLLLAGLLAAFMSTFSAFVNAGPAYIVNDIYKKYFKPVASDRHYVKASHVASFAVVTLGVIMGFFADSINSITLWITSSLYGGYVAANFLKWIWWRFNGWGYFWGMLSGLVVATLQYMIDQGASTYLEGSFLYWYAHVPAIYLFPIILGFSLLGSFLGTYLTPPTAAETLKSFYTSVHPWGWWKPVREALGPYDDQERNADFGLDMLNCLIGIIWQSSMIVLPIFLVVRDYEKTAWSLLVFGITTLILKFTWLDKVKKLTT